MELSSIFDFGNPTALIADLVICVVLALGIIFGAKRGFIRSVAGIVVLVLSIFGATVAANVLTEPVTQFVEPIVQQRMAEKLTQTPTSMSSSQAAASEMLQNLHFDTDLIADLAEKAAEKVQETGATLLAAVMDSVVATVVHAVIFLVVFIILMIVLSLIVKALDLTAKLPVVRTANGLGGAVVGLIKALLLVVLGIWVLRRFGWLTEDLVADTLLLRFFATHSLMDLIMAL